MLTEYIFFPPLFTGIERESEEEKTFADFQIEGKDSPYRTFNFTYTSDEFDRLVQLNCYNVLNNMDAILKALRLGLSKRKQKAGPKCFFENLL